MWSCFCKHNWRGPRPKPCVSKEALDVHSSWNVHPFSFQHLYNTLHMKTEYIEIHWIHEYNLWISLNNGKPIGSTLRSRDPNVSQNVSREARTSRRNSCSSCARSWTPWAPLSCWQRPRRTAPHCWRRRAVAFCVVADPKKKGFRVDIAVIPLMYLSHFISIWKSDDWYNTAFHSDELLDVNYESQPDKLASCFLWA